MGTTPLIHPCFPLYPLGGDTQREASGMSSRRGGVQGLRFLDLCPKRPRSDPPRQAPLETVPVAPTRDRQAHHDGSIRPAAYSPPAVLIPLVPNGLRPTHHRRCSSRTACRLLTTGGAHPARPERPAAYSPPAVLVPNGLPPTHHRRCSSRTACRLLTTGGAHPARPDTSIHRGRTYRGKPIEGPDRVSSRKTLDETEPGRRERQVL
jgi:hypothetical protein